MSDPARLAIGLVGYGEVGKIIAAALAQRGGGWVGTWDILLPDPASGPSMRAHATQARVHAATSLGDLLSRANLVISAVTASQAIAVAREAVPAIRPGTWFLDLNSASPGAKREMSALIDRAGGRFVESAVMTSVPPYGIRVPMLLGGAHAAELRDLLAPLGFAMEVAASEIGVASAIKMCRSVMIKGLEALVTESFTAARAYGVEERVLASLHETFPTLDWEVLGSYLMSRSALHGKRRAEEMREVAVTVHEAGLEPSMASATAARQDWMGRQKVPLGLDELPKDANWREYADRLLAARSPPRSTGS
jgi:3-hydroxyisobutyrate dehydrogenase-like beta-hydroxyacid dehydrogenase